MYLFSLVYKNVKNHYRKTNFIFKKIRVYFNKNTYLALNEKRSGFV